MIPSRPHNKNHRLPEKEYYEFFDKVDAGDIFFSSGDSFIDSVNRWYQKKLLRNKECGHVSHVGIIDDYGFMIESRGKIGPTRDFHISNRLEGKERKLIIGKVVYDHDNVDIERAISAILEYMTVVPRGYDFMSLFSFGRIQSNNKVICSELVGFYLNNLLRANMDFTLIMDKLILPREMIDFVEVTVTV